MTNPSTPETPAPLSFDSPKVRIAREWAVTQRPYKLLTISERSALILADALTHEHEARVRAEELAHGLQLIVEGARPLQDKLQQAEAERDRYRAALEFEYKENRKLTRGAVIFDFEMFVIEQVRRIEAALSGMPAQAGVKDL